MSAQVAIYVSAFLGMTALMGLFAGLIYRRHRMMVNQHRAYERMAQERIRQAQDENLPPFYIDHVRDRACVFEGEPPPDNTFLRTLEVVVVRPRRQESMQDLIDAGIISPGTGTEDQSQATPNSPHSHHRRNPSSMMGLPDLVVSEMPHLGLGIPVVESGVIRPTPAALRRPMRAMTSNNNTPSNLAAAVLVPPVPTLAATIHGDSISHDIGDGQEGIHTLPPPPSYDITHTHAATGVVEPQFFTQPVSAPPTAGDYFTHHQPHSHHQHHHNHTNTKQDNNQQQTSTPSPSSSAIEQQLNPPSSTPIETPRYSDEFPSHIPHEQHLEGYRRARAISDVSLRQQDGSPSLSAAATTYVDQTMNATSAAATPTEISPLSSSPPSLPSSAQSYSLAVSSH